MPWQIAVDITEATHAALTAVAIQRGIRIETLAREVLTQWAANRRSG
jgi:hypothetical protein